LAPAFREADKSSFDLSAHFGRNVHAIADERQVGPF